MAYQNGILLQLFVRFPQEVFRPQVLFTAFFTADLWLIPMLIYQPLPAQCITASKGLCLALKDISEKLG